MYEVLFAIKLRELRNSACMTLMLTTPSFNLPLQLMLVFKKIGTPENGHP